MEFKKLVPQLLANEDELDRKVQMTNLRAQIWKIICNIGDLQQDMLDKYEQDRKRRLRLIEERNKNEMLVG